MNENLTFIREKIKNADFLNFLSRRNIKAEAFEIYRFNSPKESIVNSDAIILRQKWNEYVLSLSKKKV